MASLRANARSSPRNWVRRGDYLNEITIIEDPVYLTEPLVRSSTWVLDNRLKFYRSPCAPQEIAVEVVRTATQIPHILPGMNKGLTEFPIRFGIPYDGRARARRSAVSRLLGKVEDLEASDQRDAAEIGDK
jgi:hypothetical protein